MATTVSIAPVSATVAAGDTFQFDLSGTDQFDDALATAPTGLWSVSGGGSIDGTGLFTAGDTAGGPWTVTATASGGIEATAQVSVSSDPVPPPAPPADPQPDPTILTANGDGGCGSPASRGSTAGGILPVLLLALLVLYRRLACREAAGSI
jgi:MYXO-CTERM domain-containing protein